VNKYLIVGTASLLVLIAGALKLYMLGLPTVCQ